MGTCRYCGMVLPPRSYVRQSGFCSSDHQRSYILAWAAECEPADFAGLVPLPLHQLQPRPGRLVFGGEPDPETVSLYVVTPNIGGGNEEELDLESLLQGPALELERYQEFERAKESSGGLLSRLRFVRNQEEEDSPETSTLERPEIIRAVRAEVIRQALDAVNEFRKRSRKYREAREGEERSAIRAAERAAAEKAKAEREAAHRAAAKKRAAEKAATEKAEAERLALQKAAAEKTKAEQEAAERIAAEKRAASRKVSREHATADDGSDPALLDQRATQRAAAEAEKRARQKAALREVAAKTVMPEVSESASLAARTRSPAFPLGAGLCILALCAVLGFGYWQWQQSQSAPNTVQHNKVLAASNPSSTPPPIRTFQAGGTWSQWRSNDGVRTLAAYDPSLTDANYRFAFLAQIEYGAFGWAFRMADIDNYYGMKLRVTGGANPRLVLEKLVVHNGEFERLRPVELKVKAASGDVYRVQMEVVNGEYLTYLNATLIDRWKDNTFRAGGVGFANELRERGTATSWLYEKL